MLRATNAVGIIALLLPLLAYHSYHGVRHVSKATTLMASVFVGCSILSKAAKARSATRPITAVPARRPMNRELIFYGPLGAPDSNLSDWLLRGSLHEVALPACGEEAPPNSGRQKK